MTEEAVSFRAKWKKRLTLRNIGIGLLVYIVLKLCGVFQFYGPYWGRVVDADTGQPIEGAGVLATYVRYVPVLSGPATKGVQEASTDESGYFFLWPRLVLDIAFPFFVFQWSPELAVVKERYQVAGTEFLEYENDTFFTIYGIEKRRPTVLGPMLIGLKELKIDFAEYRKYESNLSTSILDLGSSGFAGIILGPMKSDKSLKFSKMVRQEMQWADQAMEAMEKSERDAQKQKQEIIR